ncbi:MAG: prolipoprotein diacylglyceryl transferase, partial [Nitrosomonas sp.]|nr:prolipoprotein diacylglyceryl transferase [Nitrosomonas sp.]
AKPRAVGAISGMFLIGYGVLRSLAEFYRQPEDGFMGVLTLGITMGQWLSIPMILVGIGMLLWSKHQTSSSQNNPKKHNKNLRS